MCLALPGEIVERHEGPLPMARVCFGTARREVCLAYVPEARVGDWVIVHVGFALQRLDEAEARRTLALIDGEDPSKPARSDGEPLA